MHSGSVSKRNVKILQQIEHESGKQAAEVILGRFKVDWKKAGDAGFSILREKYLPQLLGWSHSKEFMEHVQLEMMSRFQKTRCLLQLSWMT